MFIQPHLHLWVLLDPAIRAEAIAIITALAEEFGLEVVLTEFDGPLAVQDRTIVSCARYMLGSNAIQYSLTLDGVTVDLEDLVDMSNWRTQWYYTVFREVEESLGGPAIVTGVFGILRGKEYERMQQRALWEEVQTTGLDIWRGEKPPAIPSSMTEVPVHRECEDCGAGHLQIKRHDRRRHRLTRYCCMKCDAISYKHVICRFSITPMYGVNIPPRIAKEAGRLFRKGWSDRKIAAKCRIDPKTVKKIRLAIARGRVD